MLILKINPTRVDKIVVSMLILSLVFFVLSIKAR